MPFGVQNVSLGSPWGDPGAPNWGLGGSWGGLGDPLGALGPFWGQKGRGTAKKGMVIPWWLVVPGPLALFGVKSSHAKMCTALRREHHFRGSGGRLLSSGVAFLGVVRCCVARFYVFFVEPAERDK